MFRAGFYQFRPLFGQVKKNCQRVLNALQDAEADLVVLPELAFTGYHFSDFAEAALLAENPDDSRTVDALTGLCSRKSMYIVTGFAEKRGHQLYNSALLIGPDGLEHIYRKIHLFAGEKNIFKPGDVPLQVQTIRGVRIGLMVCFDWIFPETARTLALKGAEILCHPSNLVLSYCQQAMLTRCLENNIFSITANRFGADVSPHGSLRFTGKSQVAAPKGRLIYRAKSQRTELFIAELDVAEARNKQITEQNHLLEDRRPAFYSDLCK